MKEKSGEKEIKKRTKNRSIKRTFLFGIISLTATICICSGILYAAIMYNDASNNMNTRINENMTAYNVAVQNAIQIYKTKIEAIAADATLSSSTSGQLDQTLQQLAEKNGFDTLAIADSNGSATDGADVSQREYFKQAMNNNTYISSSLVSSTTGKTVLIVSARINNLKYDGIIIATLDINTFSQMVDGIQIGKSGSGFIVDRDGKFIAHKDRNIVNDQVNYIEKAKEDSSYSGLAELMQNMISGKSDIEHVSFQGTDYVYSYSNIPNTDGWSIAVSAKTSEMMKNFYTSCLFTLLLTIIFVGGSVFMAFRITTPVVNPIVDLIERIKSLSDGDLHSPVPQIYTGNELETLSSSFTSTINTLNSYIEEISTVLTNLAEGDCTVQTTQDYKGDFIQINESLNKIISNLNLTFSKIKESSNQVATGSGQVSSAAQDLASGTTEQAATLEELNASISSVAQRSEENVSNVHKATEYVFQASKGISDSNDYMKRLHSAMEEIGDSSQKISKITKLVEDIAFQTNILALNAAVEAARAGEAGKGFAVVADEVRNLAGKSAEAAKQTGELIQKSTTSVSEGEKLTAETQNLLLNVSEKAGLAVEAIKEIESASSEQATAIEEINQGLLQISSVVQTNAATAEESSASSEELAAQAQTMLQEISKLQLNENETMRQYNYQSVSDSVTASESAPLPSALSSRALSTDFSQTGEGKY